MVQFTNNLGWVVDKKDLLLEFQKQVNENYKKLDYPSWRTLSQSSAKYYYIITEEGVLTVYECFSDFTLGEILYAGDIYGPYLSESFTEFLCDHYGIFTPKIVKEVRRMHSNSDPKRNPLWWYNPGKKWVAKKAELVKAIPFRHTNNTFINNLYLNTSDNSDELLIIETDKIYQHCNYITVSEVKRLPYETQRLERGELLFCAEVPEDFNSDSFIGFLLNHWGSYTPHFLFDIDKIYDTEYTQMWGDEDATSIDPEPLKTIATRAKEITNNTQNINNNKEEDKMSVNKIFNFEFGPVSKTQFRLSPYGLAVATEANGWVSYNKDTNEVINVDIFNFDISNFIYKMPVGLNDIKSGDVLIHSKKPVFVRKVNQDGSVSVVNYADSTLSDILPVKSPFGFNFFTKVNSFIDLNAANANKENPFGNMLPFLIFSDQKSDIDPMAMILLANQGNKDMFNFNNNPFMFYLLLNKNKDKADKDNNLTDALSMMFLLNGANNPLFSLPSKEMDDLKVEKD